MINIANLLTGGLLKSVTDIIGSFKMDPDKKAELQAILLQNEASFKLKELELQSKLQDAISAEVAAAADVIKAEAQSQSWLPRNVRPLLLLMWGTLITTNFLIPQIAQLTGSALIPLVLDSWVYKLTAIGFTGYVTARTFEKWGGKL